MYVKASIVVFVSLMVPTSEDCFFGQLYASHSHNHFLNSLTSTFSHLNCFTFQIIGLHLAEMAWIEFSSMRRMRTFPKTCIWLQLWVLFRSFYHKYVECHDADDLLLILWWFFIYANVFWFGLKQSHSRRSTRRLSVLCAHIQTRWGQWGKACRFTLVRLWFPLVAASRRLCRSGVTNLFETESFFMGIESYERLPFW